MGQKNDKIDILLKSLIKIGEIPPEDKIMDYLMDLTAEREVPRAIREKTIARLEKRQRQLKKTRERLQNPAKLNSFGEYLRLIKIKEKSDASNIAIEAQIDPGKLILLENDRISPLDFTLDEMTRLICTIGLGAQIALTLIKKSYQIFKMQPQLGKASARYEDKDKTPKSKINDMDRALKELILKSSARRVESVSEPELDTYLKALQEKLR
jgi:hypothetical protein